MAAKIGALHVSLGLDSAQFTRGLQSAQKGLGGFGKAAAIGFAAITAGAAAAAAALAPAIKGAINYADAIDEAAQKTGVAAEALSRLNYAATVEGIGLDGLTSSLVKLSKTMADAVATPTSTAATAFKALGIEIASADGTLRASEHVFADVAEAFASLEDGTTKTALAVQLFGRSGADLIPLLNYGSDGLKKMADESDRLGQTISGKTAAAAGKFNDTLTVIGQTMQGVVNKIMEAALPALQSFADTLASPEFAQAVQQLAVWIIDAMNAITQTVIGAVNAIRDFQKLFDGGGSAARYTGADLNNAETNLKGQLGSHASNPWRRTQDPASFYSGFNFTGGKMDIAKPGGVSSMVVPTFQTDAAVASLKPLDLGIETTTEKVETLADAIGGPVSDAFIGLADSIMSGVPPMQAFLGELGDIGKMLMNSAIRGLVNAALGGIGGGMFGAPATGGFSFGGPSFDGGGFTGYGPRAGGLDGKGGFLSMLHPNETITDHTKGQGGGPVMHFQITGSRQDAAAIANLVREEVTAGIQRHQRNPDRF
jgi:hypothetical protein